MTASSQHGKLFSISHHQTPSTPDVTEASGFSMPEDLINNPPFDTIVSVINDSVEKGDYRRLACGCIEFCSGVIIPEPEEDADDAE